MLIADIAQARSYADALVQAMGPPVRYEEQPRPGGGYILVLYTRKAAIRLWFLTDGTLHMADDPRIRRGGQVPDDLSLFIRATEIETGAGRFSLYANMQGRRALVGLLRL